MRQTIELETAETRFVALVRAVVLSRNQLVGRCRSSAEDRDRVVWRHVLQAHVRLVVELCTCCDTKSADPRWMQRGLAGVQPLLLWLGRTNERCHPRKVARDLKRLADIEDTLILPMAALLLTVDDWGVLEQAVANLASAMESWDPLTAPT